MTAQNEMIRSLKDFLNGDTTQPPPVAVSQMIRSIELMVCGEYEKAMDCGRAVLELGKEHQSLRQAGWGISLISESAFLAGDDILASVAVEQARQILIRAAKHETAVPFGGPMDHHVIQQMDLICRATVKVA